MPDDISHFLFTNILMNPAYTGISESENFYMHASLDFPMANFYPWYHPRDYVTSDDYSFSKKKQNAIGIYFSESKDGSSQIITPGISYAHCFNLPFNNSSTFCHKLRLGISVDYTEFKNTLNNLTEGDEIDPRYGFIYYTSEVKPKDSIIVKFLTANIGLWYDNPYGYFGFAIRNFAHSNYDTLRISKIPMEFNLSIGGRIFINKHFALHPTFNASMISGYKGEFNSYNPALLAAYNEKYFLGVSYNDMNKITVQEGAMIWKFLLNVNCGYLVKNDLNYFGYPSVIGGSIRMILNNNQKKLQNE